MQFRRGYVNERRKVVQETHSWRWAVYPHWKQLQHHGRRHGLRSYKTTGYDVSMRWSTWEGIPRSCRQHSVVKESGHSQDMLTESSWHRVIALPGCVTRCKMCFTVREEPVSEERGLDVGNSTNRDSRLTVPLAYPKQGKENHSFTHASKCSFIAFTAVNISMQ